MEYDMQELFSSYGYVLLPPGAMPTEATTTFPDEWHASYFANAFHEIDPVFSFARECRRRSDAKLLSSADMETALFEEAGRFGADSNFVSVSKLGGNMMVFGGVNHDLDHRAVAEGLRLCQVEHRRVLLCKIDLLTDAQVDLLEERVVEPLHHDGERLLILRPGHRGGRRSISSTTGGRRGGGISAAEPAQRHAGRAVPPDTALVGTARGRGRIRRPAPPLAFHP